MNLTCLLNRPRGMLSSGLSSKLAIALLICWLLSSLAEAKVTYTRVATTGDSVIGVRENERLLFGGDARINDNGEIAFYGTLFDPNVEDSRRRALLTTAGGQLRLIAGHGDIAPGGGAIPDLFEALPFHPPLINNSGQVAFSTRFQVPDISIRKPEALFIDSDGSLQRVASTGSTSTTTGGDIALQAIGRDTLRLNEKGEIAFVAFGDRVDEGNKNAGGIFLRRDDQLSLELESGTPAPGFGSRVLLQGLQDFSLNDNGDIAVVTDLSFPSPFARNDQVVFYYPQGESPRLLAQREESIQIGTESFFVEDIRDRPPSISNNGAVAFYTRLDGPGFEFFNDDAIVASSPEGLTFLARDNQPLPSIGEGVSLSLWNVFLPTLNSSGDAVFNAFFQGPGIDNSNNQVVVGNRDGELSIIAQEGMPAPGAGDGVVFSGSFDDIALNDLGQVVFSSKLAGVGIEDDLTFGLFATDANGVLQLVARDGELFDLDPDPNVMDYRVIESSRPFIGPESVGNDGQSTNFNDVGQLAFSLAFTDGSSGIFIATIGTIPEPSTALLLTIGLAVFPQRRR